LSQTTTHKHTDTHCFSFLPLTKFCRDELSERERQLRTAQTDNARTRGEIEEALRGLAEERGRLASAQASNETLAARTAAMQTRVEAAEQAADRAALSMAEEKRLAQLAADKAKSNIAALEAQLQEARNSAQELKGKHVSDESAVTDMQMRMSQMRSDLAARTAEASVAKADADFKAKTIAELEQQLRSERDSRVTAESQARRDADKLRVSEEEKSELKRDLERLRASLQMQEQHARDALEKQAAVADAQRTALQADLARLGKQLADTQGKHAQLESTHRRVADDLGRANQSCEALRRENGQLATARATAEAELARLRDQLLANKSASSATEVSVTELRGRLEASIRAAGVLKDELAKERASSQALQQSLATATATADAHRRELDAALQAKRELEAVAVRAEEKSRSIEGLLMGEQAQRALAESGIHVATGQRATTDRILMDIATENAALKSDLRAAQVAAEEATARAAECKRLWEGEITSRNQLGARVLDLEKQLQESQQAVEREKRRAQRALEKKKLADEQAATALAQTDQLQRECTEATSVAKRARAKLRDERGTRQGADSQRVTELETQVRRLADDLAREQSLRVSATRAAAAANDAADHAHIQMAQQAAAAVEESTRMRSDFAAALNPVPQSTAMTAVGSTPPGVGDVYLGLGISEQDAAVRHERLLRELNSMPPGPPTKPPHTLLSSSTRGALMPSRPIIAPELASTISHYRAPRVLPSPGPRRPVLPVSEYVCLCGCRYNILAGHTCIHWAQHPSHSLPHRSTWSCPSRLPHVAPMR
jgi:hypothetical protein